jgi:hypothetical protein
MLEEAVAALVPNVVNMAAGVAGITRLLSR